MTKIMLKDAPGGSKLIEQMVAAVADMSLALAGENDQKVAATLDEMQSRLRSDMSRLIGAKAADELTTAFVMAVHRRRRQIENCSRTRSTSPN